MAREFGILKHLWPAGNAGNLDQSTGSRLDPEAVSLVCVRHYQDVAARRSPGDRVYLVREHGNPYDADAIVVVDTDRATLGLLGRDCWLHRPLVKEGAGCSAEIAQISRGASGLLGVTIHVRLTSSPIGMRAYRAAVSSPQTRQSARA